MTEFGSTGSPDDPAGDLWDRWQRGEAPDLDEFLRAAGPLPPARLVEVLRTDLRCRYEAGSPTPAEQYLARFPDVRADPERAVELVYAEYLIREELGGAPTPEEYARRFPDLAARLRQQIDLHRLLDAADPPATRGGDSLSHPVLLPETDAATPPAWVGPFRLLELLGKGGMGAVYRAEDTVLGRHVAVKVMLPRAAADPAARARFLREARAQAAVEHDHVVAVHQVGEAAGAPFIAMPLLKGRTLADALAAEPRPPAAEAVRVAREAAEGLAAAHERGLVHRDVKPGNIWLEGDGRRVKVLDFGLARAAGLGGGADAVTQSGALVGTPAYMSPEQARGETVDHRTDLFSLGAVLYQMLAGRPPFRAGNVTGLLLAVTTEAPPPPSAANPAVPAELDALVMRLLAKDPARRPATARAAADDLRRIEAALGASPSPRPRPSRRRLVAAVALVAGLAAVGIALSGRTNSPPPDPPPADPPSVAKVTPTATDAPKDTSKEAPRATAKDAPKVVPKPAPQPAAWRPLFTATELVGFKAEARQTYRLSAEGGHAVLRLPGGNRLLGAEDLHDFHLWLEVQTPDKASGIGNLSYRVSPGQNRGVQVELLREVFGRLNVWNPQVTVVPGEVRGGRVVPRPGALPTNDPPPVRGRQAPRGEWTQVEVVCVGDTSLHAVKGEVVFAAAALRHQGKALTDGRLVLSAYVDMAVRDGKVRTVTALPPEFGGPNSAAAGQAGDPRPR